MWHRWADLAAAGTALSRRWADREPQAGGAAHALGELSGLALAAGLLALLTLLSLLTGLLALLARLLTATWPGCWPVAGLDCRRAIGRGQLAILGLCASGWPLGWPPRACLTAALALRVVLRQLPIAGLRIGC